MGINRSGETSGFCGEEIRKWRGMKRPEKMAAVQNAALCMKGIAKKNK